jgi:hypothetical protein
VQRLVALSVKDNDLPSQTTTSKKLLKINILENIGEILPESARRGAATPRAIVALGLPWTPAKSHLPSTTRRNRVSRDASNLDEL